ncbi:O-antigen translocase [Winogradskyella jejuensis]|uniref:Polysaccharide transporter, PST family n=1 Tax=Winogradskyella jejuensis TaxID=1089305 RepID=A0A1M5K9S0_9FLAO|nr:O-antigen translocase [Winogradskyella jejuensis]SHG49517.1 polysaccharide transporter, PST family [Winogradskyella jejuensis]
MFYKLLSYNAVIVFFKLVSSFIVSKVSAIFLGPSGYALVGNFRNIFQIFVGITANGFQSGTIRHIAENKNDKFYFSKIVASIIFFSFCLSVFIGIFLIIFSNQLSIYAFKTDGFRDIFVYLAVLLPLISLNSIILYIVNGLQKLKSYTVLVVLYSITNASLTAVLVYNYNFRGALLAVIIVSALTFVISLTLKQVRLIFTNFLSILKNISVEIIKSMSTYILMATYSTILLSVSYLLIRNNIIKTNGEEVAGYWEAVNKVSMFYMIFFTSIFTLYLLPKLSVNKTLKGYKAIMSYYFKRLIPLLLVLFTALYLVRFFVIKLFLTDAFISIEKYFALQFAGDFMKIIGFSLAYQFHAKKMVSYYFITDAIIYISFYIFSLYFLNSQNLEGVFYAYILSTGLYLIVVSLVIFTKNKNYLTSDEV